MTQLKDAALFWENSLRVALRRFQLVFVQSGSIHAPVSEAAVASISSTSQPAANFAGSDVADLHDDQTLVLTGLEEFATDSSALGSLTLGDLRVRVEKLLETGVKICLVSNAPKCAYPPVPGSSIIEDAKPFYFGLLSEYEMPPEYRDGGSAHTPAAVFPAVSLEGRELEVVYRDALTELGVNVLAAIDYAIFDMGAGIDFLAFLDSRELEALRGAGLAVYAHEGGSPEFPVPRRFSEFRDAVAEVLACTINSPLDVPKISADLWSIERMLRQKIRSVALTEYSAAWRRRVLHGDLGAKVLERARADSSPSAQNLSDLRDPLEWLSLGELLEVVGKHRNIGMDELFWRRFGSDLIPIRNRLSHMRLMRKGDRATVLAWVNRVRRVMDK